LCLIRHGPFAYVFSLTNWDARKFTGGETFIMNAPVLDYWRQALSKAVVKQRKAVKQ
jgi:hypothetical protein